jgi:asparagine synthase (glutamine-hydrolysing)
MIGFCGIFDPKGVHDHNYITDRLNALGSAFQSDVVAKQNSVVWCQNGFCCRLYFRINERQPLPDKRFEKIVKESTCIAVISGLVCLPEDYTAPKSADRQFLTRSYVEKQYNQSGPTSFASIDGNWAAVVYDINKKSILLARDCVGTHPLYYTVDDGIIYFSTALGALICGSLAREIDYKSLARFLRFLYIPTPLTAYKGIAAVPLRQVVEISYNAIRFHPISMPRHSINGPLMDKGKLKKITEESLVEFDKLLIASVEKRTARRGRTAIFLSGGKDSASLCVAASKINPEKYITITIGFGDQSVDESADASLVADHLGLKNYVLRFPDAAYPAKLNDYLRCHAQPFGDPAGFPLLLGTEKIPNDVEVVLDGTGNDIYMGIPASFKYQLYLYLPILGYIARLMPEGGLDSLAPQKIVNGIAFFRQPLRDLFLYWNAWSEADIEEIFGWPGEFTETELQRLCSRKKNWKALDLKTAVLCDIWEPDTAYRKVSCVCNYHNISARFPFTDGALARFFTKLPAELCYDGYKNKILLRKYIIKHLPRDIVNKPKGSFVFNPAAFLTQNNCDIIRTNITDDTLNGLSIQDKSSCYKLIEKFSNGHEKHTLRVFALFLLSYWYKNTLSKFT